MYLNEIISLINTNAKIHVLKLTVLEGLIYPPIFPDSSTSLLSNASSTFLKISKSSVAVTVDRIGSGDADRGFRWTALSLLSSNKEVGVSCDERISGGPDVFTAAFPCDCSPTIFSCSPAPAELGEMKELE